MEISISHQCRCFLLALLLGAALSLLYDVFRILRLILPENQLLIAVEDLLYLLLCGLFTMRFALYAEQGRLRGYLLFGEALGWLLCHLTAGEMILRIARPLIRLIYRVISILLTPLLWILQRICRIFRRFVDFLGKNFKKVSIQRKFFLKRRAILLYNLIKSEKRPVFRKKS